MKLRAFKVKIWTIVIVGLLGPIASIYTIPIVSELVLRWHVSPTAAVYGGEQNRQIEDFSTSVFLNISCENRIDKIRLNQNDQIKAELQSMNYRIFSRAIVVLGMNLLQNFDGQEVEENQKIVKYYFCSKELLKIFKKKCGSKAFYLEYISENKKIPSKEVHFLCN